MLRFKGQNLYQHHHYKIMMICEIARAKDPEDLKDKINEFLKDDFKLVSVTAVDHADRVDYTAWLLKDDTLKKIIKKTHKREIEKLKLLKEQSI